MGLEQTLPKAYYFSAEIFAAERERIFLSEWFCVGRSSAVEGKGDYVVIDLCCESVILLRADDGRLNAFHNVCRHRGSQLVPVDGESGAPFACAAGRFRGMIRCPYHSWAYDLQGDVRRTPHIDEVKPGDPAFALHGVEVDEWGGFVFLRMAGDEQAASLTDQLGDIPQRVARYPLAELAVGKSIRYDARANWKVILENYNECYHCAGVHPELCRIVPAFREGGGVGLDWDEGIPHRDGAYTFTFDGTTKREPFPGLNEAEQTRHNGELAYPNLMISLSCDHVAAFVLWPVGPERTHIVCDFLFHPDEMAKPDFDPADAVDFWDLVNQQDWAICENVQRGMASRAFEKGYYAPMEDMSLDIRRYIQARLGKIGEQ